MLLVFFGLIASGKSTLAQMWADTEATGYFNSDRVRKELAGLDPSCSQEESFHHGIYAPEYTEKTYDVLLSLAEQTLRKGKSVALDASYSCRRHRQQVLELANRTPCRIYFILCTCDEKTIKKRLALRAMDQQAVSDGRWEIYLRQKEKFAMPDELSDRQLLIVNTAAPLDRLLALLEYQLGNS